MILSQTAEYALRAMAQLASLPAGQAVPTADLAGMTAVPPHYLSKILRKLVAAGLLDSEKGHGGGFKLARPPKQTRFSEILEALDLQLEPNRCAFGWGQCNARQPCLLHPAYSQLKEAHQKWALKTTLADLAPASPKSAR